MAFSIRKLIKIAFPPLNGANANQARKLQPSWLQKSNTMENNNPIQDIQNIITRLRADGDPLAANYQAMATRHGLYEHAGQPHPVPDPDIIELDAIYQVEPEELRGWIYFEC